MIFFWIWLIGVALSVLPICKAIVRSEAGPYADAGDVALLCFVGLILSLAWPIAGIVTVLRHFVKQSLNKEKQ